jgi:hypothetical protein
VFFVLEKIQSVEPLFNEHALDGDIVIDQEIARLSHAGFSVVTVDEKVALELGH